MNWYQVKQQLVLFTGLHMDALHVHIGILAQMLVALVLRRSIASPWPWLILLMAAAANEWFDLTYEIWPPHHRALQFQSSIHDVWNTMLIPTLLLVLSRWAPQVLVRRSTAPLEPEASAPAELERSH